MARSLPILSALAIIWLTGAVHGRWADRRDAGPALREAAARLARVPLDVDGWAGREAEVERRGLERSGIAGLLSRRYEDRRTGASVTILLACGRPGPIAVHGPEVCYEGAGYERIAPIARTSLGTSPGDDFWTSDFRKTGSAVPRDLRISWAWNASGRWRAAESPRLAFAGDSALYKLYFIEETTTTGGRRDGVTPEFARRFLPGLNAALFPGS